MACCSRPEGPVGNTCRHPHDGIERDATFHCFGSPSIPNHQCPSSSQAPPGFEEVHAGLELTLISQLASIIDDQVKSETFEPDAIIATAIEIAVSRNIVRRVNVDPSPEAELEAPVTLRSLRIELDKLASAQNESKRSWADIADVELGSELPKRPPYPTATGPKHFVVPPRNFQEIRIHFPQNHDAAILARTTAQTTQAVNATSQYGGVRTSRKLRSNDVIVVFSSDKWAAHVQDDSWVIPTFGTGAKMIKEHWRWPPNLYLWSCNGRP